MIFKRSMRKNLKMNILTEFSDRCVIKIRDSIGKKVVGTEDYKQEEEKLIGYLGEPA